MSSNTDENALRWHIQKVVFPQDTFVLFLFAATWPRTSSILYAVPNLRPIVSSVTLHRLHANLVHHLHSSTAFFIDCNHRVVRFHVIHWLQSIVHFLASSVVAPRCLLSAIVVLFGGLNSSSFTTAGGSGTASWASPIRISSTSWSTWSSPHRSRDVIGFIFWESSESSNSSFS